MEYLLPSFLTLLSYFLGGYFSIQSSRNPVFRPVGLSEGVSLFLMLILGILPFVVSLYLVYNVGGVPISIGFIFVRFALLPAILNNTLKNSILLKDEKIDL